MMRNIMKEAVHPWSHPYMHWSPFICDMSLQKQDF